MPTTFDHAPSVRRRAFRFLGSWIPARGFRRGRLFAGIVHVPLCGTPSRMKFGTRLGAVLVDVRAGSVCLAAPRFKPGRAHCPDAASGRPNQWKPESSMPVAQDTLRDEILHTSRSSQGRAHCNAPLPVEAPGFKPGQAHCPDAASGRPNQWKSSQARLFQGNDGRVGYDFIDRAPVDSLRYPCSPLFPVARPASARVVRVLSPVIYYARFLSRTAL